MSSDGTKDIDVSYQIFKFNDGQRDVSLTLTNINNDEELLSKFSEFLDQLHANGGYIPQGSFKSLLKDIECECFDEREEEDKLGIPVINSKNIANLNAAYTSFTDYLEGKGLTLSEETKSAIDIILTPEPKPETKPKTQKKKQAEEKQDQASVPIAAHKTSDWDEKKAVKLVKQAAMHYYEGTLESIKATGLEGISNVPTWYIAATNFTPEMGKAAGAGAALTTAIAAEAGITFKKFNQVLSHIEEFEDNRQDPLKKSDALKILEQRTHEAGLLYEGIGDHDLKEYPAEKFKNIITARRLLTKKGELKESIDDVCRYLYLNPQKSLLTFGKKTPPLVANAVLALTRATISIPLQTVKDVSTNMFTPKHWKNIGSGAKTVPKMLKNFRIFSNASRHKVKQKSHFTDAAEGRIGKDHDLHGHIPPEFIKEVHETNKALSSNILQQKVEAVKFGTEALFIKEHAMTVLNTFDEKTLEGLASGEPTPKDISFAISAFSVFAVWGPFSHMGKKLTELFNVGTSARSQQAQQYTKLDNFHEEMLSAQRERQNSDIDHDDTDTPNKKNNPNNDHDGLS
ncbi:MAG: hypothetical protein ACRBB3_02785 [Alphaproteobacteria bacterium]